MRSDDDAAIEARATVADKILDAANSVMPDGSPPDGLRGAYVAIYGILGGRPAVELVGTPASAAHTLDAINAALRGDAIFYRTMGKGPAIGDPSTKLGIWMCFPYPTGGLL